MATKLDAPQERFCREYIVNLSATQAAIQAGYSERTAYSKGQQLLMKAEIGNRLTKLQAERALLREFRAEADQLREAASLAVTG